MIWKFIKYLFIPNWQPVWNHRGEWTVTTRSSNFKKSEYSVYIIYYSDSRKKYKLVTMGYLAESHSAYNESLDKLSQFNDELSKRYY